jgi:branched-chain amino acid aminotransferase
MLDLQENLAEVTEGNFFLVKKSILLTPGPKNVLLGVSRQTVFELADRLGIPWVERGLQPYDAYNADEVFLTSTSYCVLPVSRMNGQVHPGG